MACNKEEKHQSRLDGSEEDQEFDSLSRDLEIVGGGGQNYNIKLVATSKGRVVSGLESRSTCGNTKLYNYVR